MGGLGLRRHAERGMGTPLTPRGEATARALAGTEYALVVSSPLERAMRTAELIGGRPDAPEPRLPPPIGGAGGFGPMGPPADWRRLLPPPPQAPPVPPQPPPAVARPPPPARPDAPP